MIRMGRGNRTEEAESNEQTPTDPGYRYTNETQAAMGRGAISESDAMARDIKEGRLSGFVGHGTTLTGETEFHAMLRVDGHMVGSVSSEAGTLIVGTNGQVDANVMVAAAMINGNVNGDIIASEKLQLGRTARVMGNIQSPRLIVEEGAIIEGSCSMIKARETQEEEAVSAAAVQYEEPAATTYAAATVEEEEDDSTSYMTDEDVSEKEGDDEETADAATV